MTKRNIIFGASIAGFDYFHSKPKNLKIDAFCDNDSNKIGARFNGLTVISPSSLSPENDKIFICSIFSNEIIPQLHDLGFDDASIIVVENTQNYYVPSLSAALSVLRQAADESVAYVVIRNHKELMESKKLDGDIDVLIEDKDLKKFLSILQRYLVSSDGIKFDIYSKFGTLGFRHFNMPIFPKKISTEMLKDHIVWNGICIPNMKMQCISMMYYLICFKGQESKIPLFKNEDTKILNAVMLEKKSSNYIRHSYLEDITQLFSKVFTPKNFSSLQEMYHVLNALHYFPSFDTYRKAIQMDNTLQYIQNEDTEYKVALQKQTALKLQDSNRRFLMLFLRRRLFTPRYFRHFKQTLRDLECKIEVVYFNKVSLEALDFCMNEVRGGNWEDDFGQETNGPPKAVMILRNKNPSKLQQHRNSYFKFDIQDDTYFIKEKLRETFLKKFEADTDLNLFHSTDDDLELLLYMEKLGLDPSTLLRNSQGD